MLPRSLAFLFFFFNDTATTEIYTLSLHDALPISCACDCASRCRRCATSSSSTRSEEHTSELQSHSDLVCRLLLEKKNRPSLPPRHPTRLHRPLHGRLPAGTR